MCSAYVSSCILGGILKKMSCVFCASKSSNVYFVASNLLEESPYIFRPVKNPYVASLVVFPMLKCVFAENFYLLVILSWLNCIKVTRFYRERVAFIFILF